MTTARDIAAYLDKRYPQQSAPWDHTDGLLEKDRKVTNVIVALELRDHDADFFILHHPPKFGPDKAITNPFYKDQSWYALHSRLDLSGDINRKIASTIFHSFTHEKTLEDGTAIIELTEPETLSQIIQDIKTKLNSDTVKVIQKKKAVRRIAIHGGEGFNQHHVERGVNEGIDLYLAGDMTHHQAESAYFHDVTFIDIDHISEQVGMKTLAEELQKTFPDCEFRYVPTGNYWETK